MNECGSDKAPRAHCIGGQNDHVLIHRVYHCCPCNMGAAMSRKKAIKSTPITKEWMEEWLARRDAVFRDPTYENAMQYWDYGKMGMPLDKDVPLAGVHKARLLWTEATEEMKQESREWLAAHGFKETIRGQ